MKSNNGLYSHELFRRAFAVVVLWKDYHDASPRGKLDILLKECEEILRAEMNQMIAPMPDRPDRSEKVHSRVDRIYKRLRPERSYAGVAGA
jgi:hypothetical protein